MEWKAREVQFFACLTEIDIAICDIAEAIRAKEWSTVIGERSRQICAYVLAFQSDDVLFGAIFPITGHLPRPQLPAKTGAEDQVEHRLVLHDLGRCDECGQDNSCFAAINDIVGLIA